MEKGKFTKRRKAAVLCMVLILIIFARIIYGTNKSGSLHKEESITIGVTAYDKNDTFIASIMNSLDIIVKEQGVLEEVKVKFNIVYAERDQITQNSQVEKFIALGCDVICVNVVDRTSVSDIIDRTQEAGIPLIFFNREPVEDDMYRSDNIYYVGSDAKETAVLQGKIIANAYFNDTGGIDRNQNGTIEYVMLEGETGHQDALIRTEWSVKTIKNMGINVEKLDSGIANWDRSQAAALMEQWLDEYGDQIEVVICNNDDMALGAIDTLRKKNITNIKVVGVDGTPEGLEAVKFGHMMGTIQCNAGEQAESIYNLAVSLAVNGRPPDSIPLIDNRYVRVSLYVVLSER